MPALSFFRSRRGGAAAVLPVRRDRVSAAPTTTSSAPGGAATDARSLQFWILQRQQHKNGDHLVVVENGRVVSFVSLPQVAGGGGLLQAPLCFVDHHPGDPDDGRELLSERCWQESGHVHAHVHRGEIVEDVLLEQCLEEACCALPMAWPAGDLSVFSTLDPYHDAAHEHRDGCGHNQVAHGDHNDWLIPLADGSFLLSHAHTSADGTSQFFEHGRLVKVGELKRRSKQFFSFQSPKRNGYEPIPKHDPPDCAAFAPPPAAAVPAALGPAPAAAAAAVPLPMSSASATTNVGNCCAGGGGHGHGAAAAAAAAAIGHGRPAILVLHHSHPQQHSCKDEEHGGGDTAELVSVCVPAEVQQAALDKTVLNVMGICCPAEVPLIKKILGPLPGVEDVCVNVTSRTATVLHDSMLISDGQLVKALNEARLDASIHKRGELKAGPRWPNPWTMASGVLLVVAFFHYLCAPLRWVALGSVALGLPRVLLRGLVALRRLVLDINILMVLAVAGAIALGDYLEAASITFLFTLAEWLETRSSDKARAAMAAVLGRAPRHAVLLDTGLRVRVEDVKVGTALAVRAGELIPIDGVVTSGKSSVDQSTLTGESVPVEKEPDSTVWAGTMNLTGYVSMKTSALSENSAVARMVKLVEEAQLARSRTEQMVERFAKYYTPVVVLAALLVAVIPAAMGVHNVRHWLYLALVLLVVACPCALVISSPVTTTCAIAQAARLGLLIKGGTHLEALGKMKVLAMDKTGTLTEGHFRVLDLKCLDDSSQVDVSKLLTWVGSVESKASHPMAAAMTAYARAHGAEPFRDVQNFEVLPGEGVSGLVDGRLIRIGNLRLATRLGWAQDSVAAAVLDSWKSKEATSVWVGVDDKLVAVMCAGDQVRPEAEEAVSDLKRAGIEVVMLTGDSETAAAVVRRQIGDIEVHSQLLPEDKVMLIKQKKKELGVIGMIGDGINDAPALVAADVGIAMGVAGSAVAMETADVALMSNDLRKVPSAVLLGQASLRKVQQNVFFSFITKAAIVLLAALGYASLWAAVVADVGTCLLVTFNSMLLLKRKKTKRPASTPHHHHHHQENGDSCHEHGHTHHHRHGFWSCLFGQRSHYNHHHHHHHHHHKHEQKQHGRNLHDAKMADFQPPAASKQQQQQPQQSGHGECCSPVPAASRAELNKLTELDHHHHHHEEGGVMASHCCYHAHDLESCHAGHDEHAVQKCCDNSLFDSVGKNVRRRLGVKDTTTCSAKDGHLVGCNNLMAPTPPCCSDLSHVHVEAFGGDAPKPHSSGSADQVVHHACADEERPKMDAGHCGDIGTTPCCGHGQQLPPPVANPGLVMPAGDAKLQHGGHSHHHGHSGGSVLEAWCSSKASFLLQGEQILRR